MANFKVWSSVVVNDLSDDLISSVDVYYYLSSSSTALSGGSWVSSPPDWVDEKYYWQKTVTTFKDNTTSESDPVCITGAKGDTGATGATGTGIASITEEYYLSTSKETPTGGSWVTEQPAWESGKYIWTRSKIVYKNPTSTEYTGPYCDTSWEAANDVRDELLEEITLMQTTLSGVETKVDANTKSITDKVWQKDITEAVNNYDSSTVNTIRDRVTVVEQDIEGLKTTVSDVQTEVDKKADGTTVQTLSEKVSTMEQDAEGFKATVEETYATKDELDNSVSTVKSEWTQRADEIESSVSDLEGNVSTNTQNIEGISTRVKNAEGDITILQTAAEGLQSQVTNAQGDATTALQTATSVKTTVESIAIGTRNYIKNSKDFSSTNIWNTSLVTHNLDDDGFNYLSVTGRSDSYMAFHMESVLKATISSDGTITSELSDYVGQKFILSMYIRSNFTNSYSLTPQIRLCQDGANSGRIMTNSSSAAKMTGVRLDNCEDWTRITSELIITGVPTWSTGTSLTYGEHQICFGLAPNASWTSDMTVDIKKVKLELGTLPTDWSPAPEDTDESIDNVRSTFEQRADQIEASVTDVENDVHTLTTQTAEQIALLATKEEVNESLEGYYTKEETESLVQVESDAITLMVSNTYATKEENETTQNIASTALSQGAEFIKGTQTASTNAWVGTSSTISALYDGLQIVYWLPYAGTSSSATLNLTLSDGTTTGAKNMYYKGTTRVTTHFSAGSTIRLTYRIGATISGSSTTYTGWWADGSYEGSNTYDRTRYSSSVLSLETLSKSTYYVMVGTSKGYKKAASGVSFDVSYPVLAHYNTSAAISAGGTTKYMYTTLPSVTLRNNVASWTGTQYAMTYLVGELEGNTFTINDTVFTSTTPTSEDGLAYIPIGILYSTYQVYFKTESTIYAYGASGFAPVAVNAQTEIKTEAESLRQTISEQTTSITNTCSEIIMQALESYVETSNYEEFKQTVETQLSVMADEISMNFTTTTEQITNVEGDLQTQFTELYKYISFSEEGIQLGSSDSAITLSIDNDMIVFKKNGTQFGWWDGVDFHTGNIVVEVNERAQFGNFAFIPRSDGSLSFLKVGDS